MFSAFIAAISAFLLVTVQASFFSHLPIPLSSISLLIVAMCVALIRGKDLEAVVMALWGGALLDLHGLFGFGAELAAAFASVVVMRWLYRTFLSNANLFGTFLLAAAGVCARVIILIAVDGLRVLSGRDPYVLVWNSSVFLGPIFSILATGLVAVGAIVIGRAVTRLRERIFLPSRMTLKL